MTEQIVDPSEAEVEAGRVALMKLDYAVQPSPNTVEWSASRVRAFMALKAAAKVRAQ